MAQENKRKPKDKPVTLAPLQFEQALEGLLKVKPEAKTPDAKAAPKETPGAAKKIKHQPTKASARFAPTPTLHNHHGCIKCIITHESCTTTGCEVISMDCPNCRAENAGKKGERCAQCGAIIQKPPQE